jgi:hypothetical protein
MRRSHRHHQEEGITPGLLQELDRQISPHRRIEPLLGDRLIGVPEVGGLEVPMVAFVGSPELETLSP